MFETQYLIETVSVDRFRVVQVQLEGIDIILVIFFNSSYIIIY